MKNAINRVALSYKVGFFKRDFLRKGHCRILVKRYITLKFGKLCFYLFFNINIESTNNYITDAF